jgi:hypothetical protein
MVDTVSSQTINNGPRNLIMKFTNESDATGEAAVVKVDGTSATFANRGVVPGIHLKVARISFAISSGGAVRILWNATTPTDMAILSGTGTFDYSYFGGLPNPNNAGADGKILFTTVGFAAASSYVVTLEMIKGV